MQIWLAALGVGVVVAVFVDVGITTVSAAGTGGPLARRVGRGLWLLLRGVARGPRSAVLSAAGPLVLFVMFAVWLAGLWAGWALVFVADPGSVVDPETGEAVSAWARAYVAGFATFTLGTGDLAPATDAWRLVSVAVAASGFVLLTATVSYLIPVTSAVRVRRVVGMRLHGLGPDAEAMLRNGWDGTSYGPLDRQLASLVAELGDVAQSYLSYPVVHHFHPPDRTVAVEPGVAALHEVLCVLEAGQTDDGGTDRLVLRQLREVLDRFCHIAAAGVPTREVAVPPLPELGGLREDGVQVPEEGEARFAAMADRRRVLHALARDARWRWQGDVIAER